MKAMNEVSVGKCQEALGSLADAMRVESGLENFDAVRQLAGIGASLHNLAHNGDVGGPLRDPPTLGRE